MTLKQSFARDELEEGYKQFKFKSAFLKIGLRETLK